MLNHRLDIRKAYQTIYFSCLYYISCNRTCYDLESNPLSISTDPFDRKMPSGSYTSKVRVRENYHIVGFISSGTYGRVYKAVSKTSKSDMPSPANSAPPREFFAIKKCAPYISGPL